MKETKKTARAQYTLEFKQEAVRLVESGQSIQATARQLNVAEQSLFNWVKAQREGRLQGAAGSRTISDKKRRPLKVPDLLLEALRLIGSSRTNHATYLGPTTRRISTWSLLCPMAHRGARIPLVARIPTL